MIVKIEQLICDVRTAMNMNARRSGPLELDDIETLTLDHRIRNRIPDSVRRVEMDAHHSLLVGSPDFAAGANIVSGRGGAQLLILPPDYMRLVELMVDGWERALHTVTDPSSAAATLAMTPGGGMVANESFPMAVFTRVGGLDALRLFGCGGAPRVVRALYRRQPRFDAYGGIEIAEPLYSEVVEYTAKIIV